MEATAVIISAEQTRSRGGADTKAAAVKAEATAKMRDWGGNLFA